MRSFILCDWTTVGGQTASPPSQITQDESGWLDLEEYSDVVIYLDVRSFTGAITVFLETAPSRDDPRDSNGSPTYFQTIASQALAVGTAITNTFVLRVLMATATVPLARFLRWRVGSTDGNAWDITFRAMIAANPQGC